MKKILITALALSLAGTFTLSAGDGAKKSDSQHRSNTSAAAERDDGFNMPNQEDAEAWAEDRENELAAAGEETEDAMRSAGEETEDAMRSAGDYAQETFRRAGDSLQALSAGSIHVVARQDVDARESVDQILGSDVVDQSEEQIGSVSDVAFENGQIRDVFVQVGGILGFGGQLVRIPYEALDKVERNDKKMYQVGVTSQEFNDAIDNDSSVQLREGSRAEVASDSSLDNQTTAEDFEGTEVLDSQGERIGTIARIAFDENDELGAYLEVDGIEGLDDHYVQIPLQSLQSHEREGDQVYRVNLSSDEFMQTVRQAVPQANTMSREPSAANPDA